jgi:hypothetical protein
MLCTFLFRKETYEKKSALFHERSLLSALLPSERLWVMEQGRFVIFMRSFGIEITPKLWQKKRP